MIARASAAVPRVPAEVHPVGLDVPGEPRLSVDHEERSGLLRRRAQLDREHAQARDGPALVAELHAERAAGESRGHGPHASENDVVAERGIGGRE